MDAINILGFPVHCGGVTASVEHAFDARDAGEPVRGHLCGCARYLCVHAFGEAAVHGDLDDDGLAHVVP